MNLGRLGLGTNTFGLTASYASVDRPQARQIVDAALDEGITFFDTAETYSGGESELWLGDALKGRRAQVTIATKFNPANDPRDACEASLRRLQTDYIDLYFMHFPSASIPIESTLERLLKLVEEGKVRNIGCSNFSGWQVADADWQARIKELPRFTYAQNRYSLVERQAEIEVIPACTRFGLGLIPFQPLGGGLLTGKYRRGEEPSTGTRMSRGQYAQRFLTSEMFNKVDALSTFAAAHGVPMLSVALGGLASMPGVSVVIAGATTPDQVKENAAAARWIPTEGELAELNALPGI